MSPSKSLRIPQGETVLVTGANGYIATHIVDTLLDQGYNVRGTVRSEKPWLNKYFDGKYGKGRFETRILAVLEKEGALDEVVKGVAGIIHAASDVSFNPDPSVVVPNVVAQTENFLRSAAKEPSVQSVVLTSSSTSALIPVPNKEGVVVDEDTWNDETVKLAFSKAAPPEAQSYLVYAASKTEGEHAFWNWIQANKPGFAANAILPNFNTGPILLPEVGGSTMGWVRGLVQGKTDVLSFPPQWFVDVRDTAKLHVAALLDPAVESQRIFGFAAPFNWTDVISILKKLRPNNDKIPAAPENEGRDLSDVSKPSKKAEDLLRSFFGVEGWHTLEESIEAGIVDL